MKHWISLLLGLAFLLSAFGCTQTSPAPKLPVTFYYPAVETVYDGKAPVIHPEIRDGSGYEDNMEGLLNIYLKGPSSENLRSPFPRGVTVSRLTVTTAMVTLELNSEFARLSGIDLTMACVCIASTLFDLAPLERVQILAADSMLDGQTSITLDRNDILLLDTPQPTEETTQTTAATGQ